ncbi:MAG TPA: cytochrome c biogenesis protein CcdA [Longimicrobiales bacterium]|nr:cytochrome c biogenesis protein CcdA [Longimicrobiales bacterium]
MLAYLIAFSAGLLSFLSPCVLPLIPSYATYVTGMTLDDLTDAERDRGRHRRAVLIHGSLFVLGFSLVFMALGAGSTFFGALLRHYREWIERVGGVMIILFGLHLIGVFRLALASREWRFAFGDRPIGYLGSVLIGVAFGAGWTPCIGPVLAGILTLAAASETLGAGMAMLGFYSFGLAVPFLLAALLLDRFLIGYARFRPWLPWVERASGALLIVVGILLVTGTFSVLSGIMAGWTPDFILERI